jgi:hypothetical protein
MYLRKIGTVTFPKPMGININMMPFVNGMRDSLPDELQSYLPLIDACKVNPSTRGKIGYLSISESFVLDGTQRRPGIHTEGYTTKDVRIGWGFGWGHGRVSKNKIFGGIYMASNITNSCRAWNLSVTSSELGNCEHLRSQLEEIPSTVFKKNILYWMTDRTPHESLPIKFCYRQWFRYIPGGVSAWYHEHSTANPLHIQPDCEIIYGSKFEKNMQIV